MRGARTIAAAPSAEDERRRTSAIVAATVRAPHATVHYASFTDALSEARTYARVGRGAVAQRDMRTQPMRLVLEHYRLPPVARTETALAPLPDRPGEKRSERYRQMRWGSAEAFEASALGNRWEAPRADDTIQVAADLEFGDREAESLARELRTGGRQKLHSLAVDCAQTMSPSAAGALAEALQLSASLKTVKLGGRGATLDAQELSGRRPTADIDLSGRELTTVDCIMVAAFAKSNSALTSLDLTSNYAMLADGPLRSAAESRLAVAVAEAPSLHTLNGLSAVGATRIETPKKGRLLVSYECAFLSAQAMRPPIRLRALALSHAGIGPRGLAMFEEVLVNCPTLESMDLSGNPLTGCTLSSTGAILGEYDGQGLKVLARALEARTTPRSAAPPIVSLGLNECVITDKGAKAILSVLKRAPTALSAIALRHNALSDVAFLEVASILAASTVPASIDLRNNMQPLGPEAEVAMCAAGVAAFDRLHSLNGASLAADVTEVDLRKSTLPPYVISWISARGIGLENLVCLDIRDSAAFGLDDHGRGAPKSEGLDALARLVVGSRSLSVLKLCKNGLGKHPTAPTVLCDAVSRSSSISRLMITASLLDGMFVTLMAGFLMRSPCTFAVVGSAAAARSPPPPSSHGAPLPRKSSARPGNRPARRAGQRAATKPRLPPPRHQPLQPVRRGRLELWRGPRQPPWPRSGVS